jgi:hypothetical protein
MWYDYAKKTKKMRISFYQRKTYLTFDVQRCVSGGFFPNVLDEKGRVWNRKSDVGFPFLKIVKITNISYEYSDVKNNFRFFF